MPGRETKELVPQSAKNEPSRLATQPTTGIDEHIQGLEARLGNSADIVPLPSSSPHPSGPIEPGPAAADAPAALPAFVPPLPNRIAWADLLQRVFEVDALRCPACGGRMRILSAITAPDVARRILAWLDMPSRAPPLGAPSAKPEMRDEESSPDRPWDDDPGFDFDQSYPEDS